MQNYLPRLVDELLDEYVGELSALMLIGPRGCGKTTTAVRRATSVLRLDQPQVASAFRTDPDAVLAAQDLPVLIDEWQEVPESMGALKRAVDAGADPGSYLVTGSVRARREPGQWPGTGRVVPVEMYGLTVAEIEQAAPPPRLEGALLGSPPAARMLLEAPDLVGYLELALRGGFPDAVGLSARARSAWYEGYVDQLVHRDVAALESIRSPERLLRLLRAVALNTAGGPSETALAEAAGLDVRTARNYLDLLQDLRIIDRVPAWHTSRFSRLVKTPKYYVMDPGLAAQLIGIDREAALRSGDVLGRLIDTFVTAQIRPLLALGTGPVSLSHLRDRGGAHEVDLILEWRNGDVLAIEIKSSSSVSRRDARHLEWLRNELGSRFIQGVVLHTGGTALHLGDRVAALPIASLWRPATTSG
ncbi:ATP-binding protein [Occultella kanbiaonis]|uniref:ATP-binding protein n=1 Tax=Occultella kanbiaonis TaxID=2675754 RepID=UPI0013D59D74|nr:DUF4143 domain-containing protein [Occultella kanbiaonis]